MTALMKASQKCVQHGTKHFIRIPGCPMSFPQPESDPCLNPVNPLIISLHCNLPRLAILYSDVKTIHLLHILVGKINLLNSKGISSIESDGLRIDFLSPDLS